MRHVLVIGHGAIGKALIAQLRDETAWRWAVWDRGDGTPQVDPALRATRVRNVGEARAFGVELVVECAGQQAAAQLLPPLLAAGMPALIASVGALADPAVEDALRAAARHGNTRILLPAGAVGGLDYLRAVAGQEPLSVEYVSRKPPAAWRAELAADGLDADTLATPHTFFDGAADAAARRYPRNLNVAATLALHGVGMARTRVRVIADPQVEANTHEVYIAGPAGRASFRFENAPDPANPKTSLLTALSLAAEVRHFFATAPARPA